MIKKAIALGTRRIGRCHRYRSVSQLVVIMLLHGKGPYSSRVCLDSAFPHYNIG